MISTHFNVSATIAGHLHLDQFFTHIGEDIINCMVCLHQLDSIKLI